MRHKVLAAGMFLLFSPAGLYILRQAFRIEGSPHVFVMFVFSGSLTLLIGLCGLAGLLPSRGGPKESQAHGGADGEGFGPELPKENEYEEPPAKGGRHP
jgi:hypothetical protein